MNQTFAANCYSPVVLLSFSMNASNEAAVTRVEGEAGAERERESTSHMHLLICTYPVHMLATCSHAHMLNTHSYFYLSLKRDRSARIVDVGLSANRPAFPNWRAPAAR